MTFLDVPDIDEDLKNLLINQPNLAPLHGGRVYFRIPGNPKYPLMRLYRAGGGKVGQGPQEMVVRYAIEVLGGTVTGASFLGVRQLTAIAESFFDNLENVVQGGTLFQNAVVSTVVDKPDPDTGRPGRVLDAVITLRSATS